jgi:hypothetical protein
MKRNILELILLIILFPGQPLSGTGSYDSEFIRSQLSQQDTLVDNQILFNGRIWRNLYFMVKDHQFLFSKQFLPATVTINGNTFKNIDARYDIYTDEFLTPISNVAVLQLNKEMIDSFTLNFQNKEYRFINIPNDTLKVLKGYVNVLVAGKTSLYVKYMKEIAILAEENKYDLFYPVQKLYFMKDGVPNLINGKRKFLSLLDDYKVPIRNYIRKNRLRISKKDPESFIPVIQFYNSLRQ